MPVTLTCACGHLATRHSKPGGGCASCGCWTPRLEVFVPRCTCEHAQAWHAVGKGTCIHCTCISYKENR